MVSDMHQMADKKQQAIDKNYIKMDDLRNRAQKLKDEEAVKKL
jgi:hypothetical protein